MNVIGGISLTGLSIITTENYNSVPGLKLWLDSRERVEQSGGKIPLWGDKSPLITNMVQSKVDRQPSYVAPFVESNPVTGVESLGSNSKDYSFLHNGSAFGVYSILKCNLLDFPSSVQLFQTYGTANGIRVLLLGSGGRIYIDVWKDGSVVRSSYLTNVSAIQSGNVIVIFKHIYKGPGITNNINVKFGNYSFLGTNAANNFSLNVNDAINVAYNPNPGMSLKTGINLIYDWTGVSSSNIDAYDLKIMSLLNADKLIFQNLDI